MRSRAIVNFTHLISTGCRGPQETREWVRDFFMSVNQTDINMLKKDVTKINIGKRIKQKVDESKISKKELAKKIDRERTDIYHIYKNQSIDTALLVKISQAVEYNFLLEYFESKTITGKHILLIETDKAKIEEIIKDLSADGSVKTVKAWLDEGV